MCGSATLAIVVSTPCMNVASMIEIVTATRLVAGARPGSPLTLPLRFGSLRLGAGGAEQLGSGVLGPHHPWPAVMGVDIDRGAEPGMQRHVGGWVLERQPHRQTLHHLDPVAG